LGIFIVVPVLLRWLRLLKGLRLDGIGTDAANFPATLVASAFSFTSVLVPGGSKLIDRFVEASDFFFREGAITTFRKIA
jgi:hypothetical protein